MDRILSVGLKEWAIVIEAILDGRQPLLIRRGAMGELRRDYQVLRPEFLLCPTYEEQTREHVTEAWRDRLARVQSLRPDPSEAILKGYASVDAIWELKGQEALKTAASRTIWSLDFLARRFPAGSPACALLIRAHRFPHAREIHGLGKAASAMSWVELSDEITLEGARPAITDEVFHRLAAEIHQELG